VLTANLTPVLTATPEPTSILLLATMFAGVGLVYRRRKAA
jgi:hypothetical protein